MCSSNFLGIALCCLMATTLCAKEISVGILLTPKQRPSYEILFKEFTAETGIVVRPVLRNDSEYKEDILNWLTTGIVDVFYWQASQRLFEYSKSNLVQPITRLWNEEGLADRVEYEVECMNGELKIWNTYRICHINGSITEDSWTNNACMCIKEISSTKRKYYCSDGVGEIDLGNHIFEIEWNEAEK